MGKIVKFCSECEEGFAEKFGFCPNCGASLEAFEMNPLQAAEAARAAEAKSDFVQPETPAFISSSEPVQENRVVGTPAFADNGHDPAADDDDILELNVEGEKSAEEINEPEIAEEQFVPAAAYAANGNNNEYRDYREFSNTAAVGEDDGGFHVTFVEEKNGKQRNGLLLGSAALILTLVLSGFVYSLFAKSLDLAAIGDEEYIAALNDMVPVAIDKPEEPPKVEDKESGGGGGGGREEEMETSKGRLATQSREEPLISPTKTIVQKDFELKQPVATTIGDKKIKPTEEAYGLPNSTNVFGSDGRGRGGGQGEGEGDGQGGGRGRGAGNGEGTGFGNGRGDGTGDGEGSGTTRAGRSEPREPAPAGPSKALNITYKPKPKYTDEARQKNITGNVRVRVTFLPSGQIGSVAPVSNLGYGLTEQAIAAARGIRFEPQLQNGRPVAVTKVVVFTFTIY